MQNKESVLPIDIPLQAEVDLANGTYVVRLPTLSDLERFIDQNGSKYQFACEGSGVCTPTMLNEYEWVFGNSKSEVIKTVLRWDSTDIGVEFFDWASDDPAGHLEWFTDRDRYRDEQINKLLWTGALERAYQADCLARTPETYRGWWQFTNLPANCSPYDWFGHNREWAVLIDPAMPKETVENFLLEQTFDDWHVAEMEDVKAHVMDSIREEIIYWRCEKAAGAGYYGQSNE